MSDVIVIAQLTLHEALRRRILTAALICGGETPKLSAIWGSEVEMIDESRPSMKKAPAIVIGTISGTFACACSTFATSDSATIQRACVHQGSMG